MLTKLKGLGFKEAVDYGASWARLFRTGLTQIGLFQIELSEPGASEIGMRDTISQPLVHTSQQGKIEALDKEVKAKIDKAQALWDKGRPIQGTLAERYLREHRKIEGDLSKDLRFLPFFTDMHSKWSFPCLLVGARSETGEITAVQITFLNSHTI